MGHSIEGQFQGGRHADDAGTVERAGTEVVLLPSTERLRLDTDRLFALMDDQTAYPFGPIELVRREAHEIDSEGGDVERYFADRLGRIDMQQGTGWAADAADGGDVIEGSDFVIAEHDRNQGGLFIDRRLKRIQIDAAYELGGIASNGEEFDGESIALQTLEACQRCGVLDGR